MAMRLSGLMSGMDTESLIQQLVEAKGTKVKTAKKAQTKLSWKQDAWKELNKKLKNLQSKYLSNMRFASSYSKKTTKVSNSSAVSVITGEDAVLGVQDLEIRKLAKTGYLTGGALAESGSGKYTALSKLSDIDPAFSGEGTISVKTADGTKDIKVNGDTTISSVLTQLKEAGLNASFDEKNQRFFVSAKESGLANDFSISALDENGASALSALGLQVNIFEGATQEELEKRADYREYKEYAGYYVDGDRAATIANMRGIIDAEVQKRTDSYLNTYKGLQDSIAAAEKKIAEINKKYADEGKTLKSVEEYQNAIVEKNKKIAEYQESLDMENSPLTEDERKTLEEKVAALKEEVAALSEEQKDAQTLVQQNEGIVSLKNQVQDVEKYINVTKTEGADGKAEYSAAATGQLTAETEERYFKKAEFANKVMSGQVALNSSATKTNGQNAEIYLNGAKFEGSTNTFEINGLTFTALNTTAAGESITVTTENDTDGIYDMIKNFLKEYNSIINEMDKLYNADSSKGYEPLLDEEKQAMSDNEVEKYENKIKDSLLRRDENVNRVSSALKRTMSDGISINGQTMFLSDFGIDTLGYFNAPDNERNAYHIDGDPDDANTSGNADKLKSMIASDPDTVISFFSQLSKDLYAEMSDLSSSQQGYRTFGNFYDDIKMKNDYKDYTSKISNLEQKLNDYEDKWYAKFSKMETAMAKMQRNANAVTGLIGG